MTPQTATVLITGGNGSLGRVLRSALPTLGWRVRTLDLELADDSTVESVAASVTDLAAVERACAGTDAIIHLGGLSTSDHAWDQYLDTNIHGTWTVLEAARRQGVRRVALASSNHAVGYTSRGATELRADIPVRPDSLYGVSKAALEALGSFYADQHGVEATSLRIGSCIERPLTTRALASWLSYPDLVRLVRAAVLGPWNGHSTVWGISRNTRRWWSLAAGEAIGYFPTDDSEMYAADATGPDPVHVGGDAPPDHASGPSS